MIEIIDKRNGKKRVNVWFPDHGYVTSTKCDVCCYIGLIYLHNYQNKHVMFKSLITDLTISEEDLVSAMHRSTKKEIRRSDNDAFTFSHFSSYELLNHPEILDSFVSMYMKNYELKGMQLYNPTNAIINAAQQNGIVLTAMYKDAVPLAYGVYITDYQNVRSWISTSSFRTFDDNEGKRLVGRAKKRLLYVSMLYFKSIGIRSYDWGGVSSFDNPNGIDQLKMSFGGDPIRYYDETVLISTRYKLFYN